MPRPDRHNPDLDPLGWRVHACGFDHRHQPPFRIHRPLGSGDWLLVVFTTEVLVTLAEGTLRLQPTTALLYGPDDAQEYRDAGCLHADHWIHFDGPAVTGLLADLGLVRCRPWPVADATSLAQIFHALVREDLRRAPHHRTATAALLVQLLVEAARAATPLTSIRHETALRDLRAHVHAHLEWPWTTQGLARRVGLSPPHLGALYRSLFGLSPIDDLLEARIARARLLLASGRSVAEAAEATGFNDLSYFHRQFRRRAGCTPGACRDG